LAGLIRALSIEKARRKPCKRHSKANKVCGKAALVKGIVCKIYNRLAILRTILYVCLHKKINPMSENTLFIIIVDDDPVSNMINSRLLKMYLGEVEVLNFVKAREALAYFQNPDKPKPDILLLDINMPIMDGWDFLSEYNKIADQSWTKQLKIFMLSSSIDRQDIEKARRYEQVSGFLPKPIDQEKAETILQVIQQ